MSIGLPWKVESKGFKKNKTQMKQIFMIKLISIII